MDQNCPRSPRPHGHCLICYKIFNQRTSLIRGDCIGAVDNALLLRQVQHFFIARNLLDIPSEWIEDILQKNDGHCDPCSWFNLCDYCLISVDQAWQIHHHILKLQAKLKDLKKEMRSEMQRGVRKIKRQGHLSCQENGIDFEIRKLLFPDLKTVQNPRPHLSSPSDDIILDHDNDHDSFSDFIPEENESDDWTDRRESKVKKAKWHFKMCSECPARFKTSEEFDAHQQLHLEVMNEGGKDICKLCGFPTRNEDELNVHIQYKHIHKKDYSTKKMNCPQSGCDFKTQTWKHLKAHVDEQHPDLPEDQLAELNLDLKCQKCSKLFDRISTLSVHQKKMHPELFGAEIKSFQCPHCSLIFADDISLKFHIKNEHFRMKRFVCDECGKGFPQPKHLERHKISHLNQKGKREYICDICGVDYAYFSILQQHYRRIHPEKNKGGLAKEELKCKYCDMKTPYWTLLRRHLKTHKGFDCDVCDRKYTSAAGLKRHKAINHSKSRVHCPHCQKAFPHQEYCNTHIRLYCKMKTLNEKMQNDGNEYKPEGSCPSGSESATGINFSSSLGLGLPVAKDELLPMDLHDHSEVQEG